MTSVRRLRSESSNFLRMYAGSYGSIIGPKAQPTVGARKISLRGTSSHSEPMSSSAWPAPYTSAVSQCVMPLRYAASNASLARLSSLPCHPTETPSGVTCGPPCPHVPREMAGTWMFVRPRRMVRIMDIMSCELCDNIADTGDVVFEDEHTVVV